MAGMKGVFIVLLLVYSRNVESATLLERSYEYVMSWGKSLAPGFLSLMDCFADNDVWECTKTKAGSLLDNWDEDVKKQRSLWQDQADAEVRQSGRELNELPSRIGGEVETSLFTIADLLQHSIARSFAPKKHGSGIDTITVTTSKKKKDKKKKKKPTHVHVVEMPMEKQEDKESEEPKQSWVVGTTLQAPGPRGFLSDAWSIGEKTLDSIAEHAIASENEDNGVEDKSSVDEQRGKKKKKKKAILKLLLLGAVLKAKIATLLQILSFKLQVKFLLIALAGLLINVARFWIDAKKQTPPQKVIYYEHAQHQHHYDHEEESGGWGGPWSRSMEPEAEEGEQQAVPIPVNLNSPYRAQERYSPTYIRPAP